MKNSISIVDYGVGNLKSVYNAFKAIGANPVLVSSITEVLKADRLLLPGVGAFAPSMDELKKSDLVDSIKEVASKSRPILGICVGMQLLFSESSEHGMHTGLSFIQGKVQQIGGHSFSTGTDLRLPVIGWHPLQLEDQNRQHSLFKTPEENAQYYFVHSYECLPEDKSLISARYLYEGHKVVAAVQSPPFYGLQFHAEKSGKAGLKIFERFLTV